MLTRVDLYLEPPPPPLVCPSRAVEGQNNVSNCFIKDFEHF